MALTGEMQVRLPQQPVLPHDLDDIYGPGAEESDNVAAFFSDMCDHFENCLVCKPGKLCPTGFDFAKSLIGQQRDAAEQRNSADLAALKLLQEIRLRVLVDEDFDADEIVRKIDAFLESAGGG